MLPTECDECATIHAERAPEKDKEMIWTPAPVLNPVSLPMCTPTALLFLNILGVKDKHKGQAPTQEWQDVTARCSNYKKEIGCFFTANET